MARGAAIADSIANATVADFLIPSPITLDRANYWDPVHYRLPIAERIMADLAAAAEGRPTPDDRILTSGHL